MKKGSSNKSLNSKSLSNRYLSKSGASSNGSKNKGITLIALVISIIVILILAGVSLSATVGDNGVITKAQQATLTQKIASYLEEFEMNKVGAMIDQGIDKDFCINYKGTDEGFLEYVPSIKDVDKEDFEIIAGYLIYTGSDETTQNICKQLGFEDEFSQTLYDSIGKEFAYYISSFENAKANGTIPSAKLNLWLTQDGVAMSEFATYANIPDGKYENEFVLNYGYITYVGTNEDRLMVLANSSTLRSYIADGIFQLANYVAPVEGNLNYDSSTGKYVINDWIIEEISENGSIKYGAIVGYTGSNKVVTIPDTFNTTLNGSSYIFKITTVKGDGTNNIFKTSGSSAVSVVKVTVAKGIYQIINRGLANLGDDVQCHILYVGSDLTLGNDKSNSNVLGYEGIENTCGSFTFVAPSTGNYTFKLWGASSGQGWSNYDASHSSSAGLGGYSQGTISLNENDKIYAYIGGTGLKTAYSLDFEDGSCGYNGGGSGYSASDMSTFGGGGATDIRFGGSEVTTNNDCRILVAGGGGAPDNANGTKYGHDDGTGGNGGGTIYGIDENGNVDYSLWSGTKGYINGSLTNSNCAVPGMWTWDGTNYIASGYSLFFAGSGGYNRTGDTGDMGGGRRRLLRWLWF